MEIKICRNCLGTGEIKEDVGTHQSDYEYKNCSVCNGTGRVKTNSYSYCVPFDTENEKIYKVDSEIIDLIRKLESNKKQ